MGLDGWDECSTGEGIWRVPWGESGFWPNSSMGICSGFAALYLLRYFVGS